jgi:hypothetical protein
MNRNQKIAIGCGAAGCLGLIVIVVAGCLIYFLMPATRSSNSNRNTNSNRIFSSNSNSNSNSNANSSDSNSNSSDNGNSSSMSDDDKHKLFQAAAATQDPDLAHKAWKKLGLADADGSPNDQYAAFAASHVSWVLKNSDFIQSVSTPEKARAYVEAHLND